MRDLRCPEEIEMTSGARAWAEEGCPMEKTEPAMVMVDRKRLAAMEAENPVQAATRYRIGNDLAECAERLIGKRHGRNKRNIC